MHKFVEEDYNDRHINTLCTKEGEIYRVVCNPTTAPLEPVIKQFWIMTEECNCEIFIDCWEKKKSCLVTDRIILTPGTIIHDLWLPVFTECKELHKHLLNGTLLLSEVDKLFKNKRLHDIKIELSHLHASLTHCAGETMTNAEWIEEVLLRMDQYWQLCQSAEAAKAFLLLIDALELDSLKVSAEYQLLKRVIASQVICILSYSKSYVYM